MGEKILSLTNGVILAWIPNFATNKTTLLSVGQDGVHAFVHDGIVLDIAKYLKATASLDYVAVAEDNAVVILAVNINDPTEWQRITILTATNFDETDFCPVEIRSQSLQAHPWGWFIILSNCNNGKNYSQEIFTWAVTKDSPTPALPLSSFDSPRNICAFMREILVVTHERVYGVSIADDLNYWSVPLNTFNIDIDKSNIYCLESQNLAILVGFIKGSNQRTSIFIRGNSGYRQDRRYPHVLSGLSSDRIQAHDFLGSILITAEEFGEIGFVQSYIDPVVTYSTKSVAADTVVDVEVTVSNASTSSKFTTHVTVKKPTEQDAPTPAAE